MLDKIDAKMDANASTLYFLLKMFLIRSISTSKLMCNALIIQMVLLVDSRPATLEIGNVLMILWHFMLRFYHIL